MNDLRLLKIAEVAEQLGISRATAYNLCLDRKLPCIKIGRSVRVQADELARYIAAAKRGGKEGEA